MKRKIIIFLSTLFGVATSLMCGKIAAHEMSLLKGVNITIAEGEPGHDTEQYYSDSSQIG